jgi:Calcineurin-like phosphoesterase
LVWILHISDLHRSHDFPIDNLMLVESIRQDVRTIRGLDEPVDIIIASGDLIQGSRKESLEEANAEVEFQYAETRALLDSFVNSMARGNWSRLVVVPGNHDVCWAYSKAVMRQIELPVDDKRASAVSGFRKDLQNSRANTRWNWDDLSFYRVDSDLPEEYAARFNCFSKFCNELPGDRSDWQNTDGHRFTIQIYNEHQIVVVGFCSCFNVDHLNHVGGIHPSSIAKVEDELRSCGAQDFLRIAVWHHNTKGGPTESDYMHDAVLENFTQFRYAIGFHGHQHKSEVLYRHSAVDLTKTMAVVSAASLCAGAWALPTGHNRGYNLVRVEEGKAFVWARELHEIASAPVWRDSSGGVLREVLLRADATADKDHSLNARIIHMVDHGQHEEVVKLVESMDGLKRPTLRAVWIDSVKQLHDNPRMAMLTPENSSEAVLVLEALENINDTILLRKRLAEEWTKMNDASVEYLVSRLNRTLDSQGAEHV